MNATLSPATGRVTGTPGAIAISTPPMQAGYTGGAPGTPTFSWTFVAPIVSPAASFLNPANSSSQIVRIPAVAMDTQKDQGVQVTVTDSLGNVSTQTATASAIHNSIN